MFNLFSTNQLNYQLSIDLREISCVRTDTAFNVFLAGIVLDILDSGTSSTNIYRLQIKCINSIQSLPREL